MSKIISALEDKGFTRFQDKFQPESYCSYQLKIRNDKGEVKYFLNVTLFDYRNKPYSNQMPKSLLEDYQSDYRVQFTNEFGTFNVQYLAVGEDLDKVIAFFDNTFEAQNCYLYE